MNTQEMQAVIQEDGWGPRFSFQIPLLQLSGHSWSCEDLEEILFHVGWTYGYVCLGTLLNTFFKSGENHTQWNLTVIMKAPRKIPVLSEQDFPNHQSVGKCRFHQRG